MQEVGTIQQGVAEMIRNYHLSQNIQYSRYRGCASSLYNTGEFFGTDAIRVGLFPSLTPLRDPSSLAALLQPTNDQITVAYSSRYQAELVCLLHADFLLGIFFDTEVGGDTIS
jgi:hypothetical protein